MSELEKNLRWWGRAWRYMLGLALMAWAIAGGPWWAYSGLYPLTVASFGFSPISAILRAKPARR